MGFIAKRRNLRASLRPEKILIVKTDQLGDVLFSTLLVETIKRQFPNAQISYLVRPQAAQVLLNNPHIHRIFHWHNLILEFLPGRGNRNNLPGKLKENTATLRLLKNERFDIVINARAYPPSSNLFLKGLGKRLVTFDIAEQSFLADDWANYDFAAEEWSNYANLLASISTEPSTAETAGRFFNLHPTNPWKAPRGYYVLAPVTFDKDRQWKPEYWSELIESLVSNGVSIAVTGIPSQRSYLMEILRLPPKTMESVQVFSDLALPEFGTLMNGASLFIGVDSFPAHLALSLGKPVRLLINSDSYYLKGYSKNKFAHEARCMISRTPQTSFFNVKDTTPEKVLASC
jgi:heptosyltransferase-3